MFSGAWADTAPATRGSATRRQEPVDTWTAETPVDSTWRVASRTHDVLKKGDKWAETRCDPRSGGMIEGRGPALGGMSGGLASGGGNAADV